MNLPVLQRWWVQHSVYPVRFHVFIVAWSIAIVQDLSTISWPTHYFKGEPDMWGRVCRKALFTEAEYPFLKHHLLGNLWLINWRFFSWSKGSIYAEAPTLTGAWRYGKYPQ